MRLSTARAGTADWRVRIAEHSDKEVLLPASWLQHRCLRLRIGPTILALQAALCCVCSGLPRRTEFSTAMRSISANVVVSFHYDVHFTTDLFDPDNPLLLQTVLRARSAKSLCAPCA